MKKAQENIVNSKLIILILILIFGVLLFFVFRKVILSGLK